MPVTFKPERKIEDSLADFAGKLRAEGLPVGTVEIIDALRSLAVIDPGDRLTFKRALQATLVKRHSDKIHFDRLFDQFFIPAEINNMKLDQKATLEKESGAKLEEARKELQFKGEPLKLSPAELTQYSDLAGDEKKKLQQFVRQTEDGNRIEPQFRPILENIVKSQLRYWRNRDDQRKISDAIDQAGGAGEGAGSGSGEEYDQLLRELDIEVVARSNLSGAELLLQKLSRKLAVKILRRRRSGPRSELIDLRRSLRDNMQYGGVFFKVRLKPKKRTRDQLLLLCDVSASMKNYSTFVIHFLRGLNDVVRDLSCFSFSDGIEDLSTGLKDKRNLQQLMDRVIRKNKTWGGGTDIGSSLKKICESYPEKISAKTTVIIVSDTKTIQLEKALNEIRRMREKVKRIIWLNPLAYERWDDYRSVRQVGAEVDMWSCNTIAQLEAVLTGRL